MQVQTDPFNQGTSRRLFLKQLTAAGMVLATSAGPRIVRAESPGENATKTPWYRRITRWGQTNITEIDPTRYDIDWWRAYWRRTGTQGVIVNAGGIIAYYPTEVPFHQRAEYLNGRDLFGELCRAAHLEGLVVFARMDSNRAHADCYEAHPDWFAIDKDGKPYKAGELFVTCVNGPYYREHLPAVLREIAARYHPEGFTDNSWSGLGRNSPCYCDSCETIFRERTQHPIPRTGDWNDPLFRQWIQWNYERRLEIWEFNNGVTKSAGGPDCIWVGMNSGSITGQCQSFRNYREICRRTEIIMLDHQSRGDASGFQNNGETGKLVHGLLGWDKLIPESMAMYQAGRPTFRQASKPEAEARLWMLDGIAGGLQPWWHHVGAYQEDRRMFRTAEPVYRWHKSHEEFLVHRQPIASVGVVWSQSNTDFYGRDDAELLVELPWRGLTQALIRARIPYLPVHADDLVRDLTQFSLLILPNVGAMSEGQIDSVRRFVEGGGGLLATGQSSLFDEWGDARRDFGLAAIFGAHLRQPVPRASEQRRRAAETDHTYLRLAPELRAKMDGPHVPTEPKIAGHRHRVLAGFEETDIIPFGGVLDPLILDRSVEVPLTFIPPSPVYPPETAWMREPKTDIPGLILSTHRSGGHVAFLPADLDRRFGRDNLPDHGNLLANLVRWTAGDSIPLQVSGPGLIDCHLYRQSDRLLLHLVNLTNAGTWRQPANDLIPVGPVEVRIRSSMKAQVRHARLLVCGDQPRVKDSDGWLRFQIHQILDHEFVVLG